MKMLMSEGPPVKPQKVTPYIDTVLAIGSLVIVFTLESSLLTDLPLLPGETGPRVEWPATQDG